MFDDFDDYLTFITPFLKLFIALLLIILGAFAIKYDVGFWLPYIVQKPVNISFFGCFFASIFCSRIAIAIAIITILI